MERFKTLLSFLGRCLPHLLIINSLILITFVLIDRVNNAMNFIDNSMTKGLLLITCVVAVASAVLLIIRQRHDLPTVEDEQYIDDEEFRPHDEISPDPASESDAETEGDAQ